jgi:hypothetical protein
VIPERGAADHPVVHGARRVVTDHLLADRQAARTDHAHRAEPVGRWLAGTLETDVGRQPAAEADVVRDQREDALRRRREALLHGDLVHRRPRTYARPNSLDALPDR